MGAKAGRRFLLRPLRPLLRRSQSAVTPLTLYPITTAATTVATADQLVTAPAGTATAIAMTVAKRTGLHQLRSSASTPGANLGATGTAVTTGSPAPDGNGWLFDVTTLEGQDLLAAAVQAIVAVQASATTISGRMYVRFSKRSSAGVYTGLTVWDQGSGSAFTTTAAQRTLPSASIPLTSFGTGDKLYVDVYVDVTANTANSTTATISFVEAGTSGAISKFSTGGYSAHISANLTGTVGDTAAATDVAGAQVVRTRTASDNAAASDVASGRVSLHVAASDSAAATDVPNGDAAFSRTAADSAGATESLTRQSARSRTVGDLAHATDVGLTRVALTRTGSDSVGGTDASDPRGTRSRAASDSAPLSDAITRQSSRSRAVTDSLGGSESLAQTVRLKGAASDSAPATDVASATSPAKFAATSDSAAATDSVARGVALHRTAGDNSAATDAAIGRVGLARAASDAAPASDAVTRIGVFARTVGDTALASDGGASTPTFVKRICSTTDATTANPKVLTVSGNTTVGNTVILVVKASAGIQVSSVTDSRGNTWQVDEVSSNTSLARVSVASAQLTTALITSDTITVTFSGAQAAGMAVYEYSGLALSGYVDGTPQQGNATSGTSLSVPITTANANDLVLAVVGLGSGTTSLTIPTGFALRDSGQAGASGYVQAAELAVTSTGTYTANWSWLTSQANAGVVVAYKAAVSGGATRGLTAPRTTTDSLNASDVAAPTTALAPTTADSAPATDSVARRVVLARSATDSLGGTETLGRAAAKSRTASDSAPLSDALARLLSVARAISDTAATSDVAARLLAFARATSDTASATDAVARAASLARSVTDTALAVEAVTSGKSRTAADSAPATDVATRAAMAFARSASDALTVVDAVARVVGLTRAVSDVALVTDSAVRSALAFLRQAADTAGAADTVARVTSRARTGSDSAPGTDSVSRHLVEARSVTDSAPTTESIARAMREARSTSDNAGTSESVGRMLAEARAVGDTLSLSETAVRGLRTFPHVTDAAGLTDAATRALMLSRTASDSAPAVESITSVAAFQRTASDGGLNYLQNTFEGGTNGATLTTANSGGASGDAFDAITGTGTAGVTIAFDGTHAAHGALALKLATAATAGALQATKTFPAAGTTFALRFYAYLTANPASPLELAAFRSSGGSNRMRVRVLATGKAAIYNAAGTQVGVTATSVALNQWVRIEVSAITLDVAAGAATLKLFNTMDSSTADETLSVTAQNFGGTADRIIYGSLTSTSNVGPFWLDDVAANTTGAAIGPFGQGGTTDFASRSLFTPRTLSDSLPATDSASVLDIRTRSVSDSAPEGDGVTRQLGLLRPLADSLGVSDVVSRRALDTRASMDALPLIDSVVGGRFKRYRFRASGAWVSKPAYLRTAGAWVPEPVMLSRQSGTWT